MNTWVRLLWGPAVLLLCLVGLIFARSGWCAESDVHQHKTRTDQLARLDRQTEVMTKRLKAKTEVTLQLLKGRLTLFEAAAWFRFFNENPPDCPAPLVNTPVESDNAKSCREVIRWVGAHLIEAGASYRDEQVRQLENLLEEQLARTGTVLLPELGEAEPASPVAFLANAP
jgi:hypothetical protein